jgi:hypothetical protein
MPDGLPNRLNYNFDRAFLEVSTDDQHCPPASRAFFSLRINERGEVSQANGHIIALSEKLTGVALKWVGELLQQMRFSPLKYGNKPSSVDTAVTVVCEIHRAAP